jgi:signal transduction histidine kinase
MRSHGLGLISMRERMNLVNGNITITSRPGEGTTVSARVRFRAHIEPSGPTAPLPDTESTAARARL